jgi:RNA polymerase sigma factor (sigma-70 family)
MAKSNPIGSIDEVIVSIREGEMNEHEGFGQIFDEMNDHICRVIRRTAKAASDDGIADIAATVWKEIWSHLDRFDPEKASFKTWAGTIAHHKAVDYIRAEKARPRAESLDVWLTDYPLAETVRAPDARTPLEEVIDKEIQMAALSVLMEFPEFDRTLYLLKLNFDLTYADLAEIASRAKGKRVTEKSVQNRVYRLREKLLAALRDQQIVD